MNEFLQKLGKKAQSKLFWTTLLIGAVPLLAQDFGYELPGNYDDVVNTLLGLLVMVGLLHSPDKE